MPVFRVRLNDQQTKAIPRRLFVAVRRTKDSDGNDVFWLLEEKDLVKGVPTESAERLTPRRKKHIL